MNFAFYVSGNSMRLIKFLKQTNRDNLQNIKVVISEYTFSKILDDILKEYEIEHLIINYALLEGRTNKEKNLELSNRMLKVLKTYDIEYLFSFGNHILSGKLLEDFQYRIINFHPALLPMYPGRKAIDQAIEHGNTFLVGNTAHFIDEGIDTGLIIMQSVIPLQSFFNESNNYDIILDLQIDMLNKLLLILEQGKLTIKDNRVFIEGANYQFFNIYPKIF